MSLVVVARRITPLGGQIRITAVADSVGAVLAVPVVMGLAYGYRLAGVGSLLLVLAPVLAAHLLLRLYRETADLSMRLSEGNMTFALSLVRALDARDEHTAGHSAAVAVYARDLANAQGLPIEDVAKIQLAALLHDIGKIGVPTEVLNKQGPLDDEEWSHIRRHPEIGEQIAGEAPFFAEISRFIRHHHERPDGRGYPDGLVGDRIPLASAIIGLADAYNAMTSCRAVPRGARARGGRRRAPPRRRRAVRPPPRRRVRERAPPPRRGVPAGPGRAVLARWPAHGHPGRAGRAPCADRALHARRRLATGGRRRRRFRYAQPVADVLIIGGGIIGATLAAQCARRGLVVTLCERDRLASAASGRNAGFVVGPHPPELAAMAEHGLREYRELHFATGAAFFMDRDVDRLADRRRGMRPASTTRRARC